jgi:hypothetical protein
MRSKDTLIITFFLVSLFIISSITNCKSSSDSDATQNNIDTMPVVKEYESDDGLIRAYVSYPKAEISIIEELKVELEIHKPEDVIVIFPSKEDIALTHFTISEISSLETETMTDDNKDKLSKSFTLTPESVGEGSIDSIKIEYRSEKQNTNDDESNFVLETNEIIIPIFSYTGIESSDVPFEDELKPESINPDYSTLIITLVIIGSVILIAGVVILIVYKLKKNKKQQKDLIVLPPGVKALKSLRDLRNEGLIDKGEVELFHRRLSNILREYIEGRFRIHAPEQTTEEFIWEMSVTKRIKGEHQTILRDYLKQCDLIKFAKYRPPAEYHNEALKIAEDFVKNTSEREEDTDIQKVKIINNV